MEVGPNQAALQTPTSGTPAAGAPVAPPPTQQVDDALERRAERPRNIAQLLTKRVHFAAFARLQSFWS